MERRTLTVIAADMEGYSAMMEHVEIETHVLTCRAIERASEIVESAGGWTLQLATGDGQIYAFSDSSAAVRAVLAFLRDLRTRPLRFTSGDTVEFRIGIHRGPVLIDGSRHVGNTVNYAARLQAAARPGTALVSEPLLQDLPESDRGRFHLSMTPAMKNLRHVGRVYSTHAVPFTRSIRRLGGGKQRPIAPGVALLPVPERGASSHECALLEQTGETFQDHLHLFHDLEVHTARRLRDAARHVNAFYRLCRLEGIRYVLQLRTSPQGGASTGVDYRLFDTWSDTLIYRSRIDDAVARPGRHSPSLQRAAVKLWSMVQTNELREVQPQVSVSETVRYHLARRFVRSGNVDRLQRGTSLLMQLLRTNRRLPMAWVELSYAYQLAWRYDTDGSRAHFLDQAVQIARALLRHDPKNSSARRELGYALMFQKRNREAIEEMTQAVLQNPLDTLALSNLAEGYMVAGDAARSIVLNRRSLWLDDTHFVDWRLWSLADAQFVQRDYDAVVATVNRMGDRSEGLRLRAASEAMLGQKEAARETTRGILAKDAGFSVDRWREKQPDSDVDEIEHYCDGLLMAGLPH